MSEDKCCPDDSSVDRNSNCCSPKPGDSPEGCSPLLDKTDPACCPAPEQPASSCCPPGDNGNGTCCPPSEDPPGKLRERPGYRLLPFVEGWLDDVPRVRTQLQRNDRLGHWAMRWGFGRDRYSIAPGLYAVGQPDDGSPVLVSANYKMSFDLLRSELGGIDAWIMVIDTKGINVWCAAGKGTFGTDEIVRCVKMVGLAQRVSHRRLIVPQLGAPGVAAHEVRKRCGFLVVYGPVRARDLKAFFDAGLQASAEMRKVTFSTWERFILTPVELTGMVRYLLWTTAILLLLGGIGEDGYTLANSLSRGGTAVLAVMTGLLSGAVLTPVLLPWLPGRAFSLKGAVTGVAVGIAVLSFSAGPLGAMNAAALLLVICAVSSYSAMNFTGSTTFTSPSGVEKEMRRAIPCQLVAVVVAAIAWFGSIF